MGYLFESAIYSFIFVGNTNQIDIDNICGGLHSVLKFNSSRINGKIGVNKLKTTTKLTSTKSKK